MKITLATVFILVFPLISFAHPGHGEFTGTWLHYLASIQHFILLVIPIVALILMYKTYVNTKRKESKK